MNKILIISPHFPPSNLAAVHRSRLFAQHLPEFGWEPIVLMVDEKYYEEPLDYNLEKLLPENLRIEKVNAFNVTKPRVIGDIGLRAFYQLYKRAKQLIRKEKIDLLYIPIPSFYCALLGRLLSSSTGIKYGIDYIDPWVHHFSGSDKIFSRHWFSTKIANFLEPIAVKNASLITGVAEGYYQGVIDRNPKLKANVVFGAMPYGGELMDHAKLASLNIDPYLFEKKSDKIQLVYAGAMLPKAYGLLQQIFSAIQRDAEVFKNVEFHFIGTGKRANDVSSYNIKPYAVEYGLWETVIFEYPQRIPYLDVLIHLNVASAVFILGSTEPHYTPSKVYQGILAGKAIVAVLHEKSTAASIITEANAGKVLTFDGEENTKDVGVKFTSFWESFIIYLQNFKAEDVDTSVFNKFSAYNVTNKLATLLNKVIG
jgi:hypothetical protein